MCHFTVFPEPQDIKKAEVVAWWATILLYLTHRESSYVVKASNPYVVNGVAAGRVVSMCVRMRPYILVKYKWRERLTGREGRTAWGIFIGASSFCLQNKTRLFIYLVSSQNLRGEVPFIKLAIRLMN